MERTLRFSVDAALLRELGERLVGKPFIALAEMVKNSYDADATKVQIRFEPGENTIEVSDNGHGMDEQEIEGFWMRIGTTHKQRQRISRELKRPLTGSKGVGRLAAQFLARKIKITTVPKHQAKREFLVFVDWEKAIQAETLTEATAILDERGATTKFPGSKPHGTRIVLSELNQRWDADSMKMLAQEIWPLQPPFRSNPDLDSEDQRTFEVSLVSSDTKATEQFDRQMRAFLDVWHAKLVGKLVEVADKRGTRVRTVQLALEFSDGKTERASYPAEEEDLSGVGFEIRVFHLTKRQPHGIKVGEARDYLNEFGGVHIYDAGFHLPYYGPDVDWLEVEFEHAHRLSRSKLLPEEFQVPEGLQFLPTNSRLFGVVHVNTSREYTDAVTRGRAQEGHYLKIQVTRDRLTDNQSFHSLRRIVRWAVDYYAMAEARRQLKEAEAQRPVEHARAKFEHVDQVIAAHKDKIPKAVYSEIRQQVSEAIEASESEAERVARQIAVLGPLATAGIVALAQEHEFNRQFRLLEGMAKELRGIEVREPTARKRLQALAGNLDIWIEQARSVRKLFAPLVDAESRETKARLRARALLDEVRTQVASLMRGVEIDIKAVDRELRLPLGTFAEWSAIFQNVFFNALNAMLDADERRIVVSSAARGRVRSISVQDTGSGVDLRTVDELFKPFVRKLVISPERKALAIGGSGLGLAIVKMLGDNLGCKVHFVKPNEGFSTAFELSWSELE